MAEDEPDAVVHINTVIKSPEELAAIQAAAPHVIREIVNSELVLDPLGQMPFKAADIPPLNAGELDEGDSPIEFPPAEVTGVVSEGSQTTKAVKPEPPDPDRYLMAAKQVVVTNYNAHRDGRRSPELTMSTVYIVWFSKTLSSWKAVVESPIVRGLLWVVTHNGPKRATYIDVYKKINNVTVPGE